MIAKVLFEGRTTNFEIDNANDHIQGYHARGEFYELRQLLAHRDLVPMHSTIIDVGANVGNHTMFYARYTWASRVYPFEPNRRARELLERNANMNSDYRAAVDMRYSTMAVGSEQKKVRIDTEPSNNLGGARVGHGGDAIDCNPLDRLEFEGRIAFVKIDVEGMELEVLAGMQRLVTDCRPFIAIEVEQRNERPFWEWVRKNGYLLTATFCDYLNIKNYVLAPAA